MPGVTIGYHALIAAGSVVTKSVPPGVVVAGNLAKQICSIEEFYERNKKYDLHTKGVDPKSKREILMSTNEELFIKK